MLKTSVTIALMLARRLSSNVENLLKTFFEIQVFSMKFKARAMLKTVHINIYAFLLEC